MGPRSGGEWRDVDEMWPGNESISQQATNSELTRFLRPCFHM